MGSSYLSPEVLDSKVKYMSILFKVIYNFGDDRFKHFLRIEVIPHIPVVLDRFENNLILPLSKYEQIQF